MGLFAYKCSRVFLRVAFRLTGGLEVIGRANVPPSGPLIVAANHASHLDPMILGAALDRDLHFMARRSLFDVPGFGWLIRQNQAFPLNRDGDSRDAIRTFGEHLEKDRAVVIFPEGTRSTDGAVAPAKPGVGMIAARYASPVLPVYIWGSFQAWPRGQRFPRPHRLKVLLAPVVPPSAGDGEERKAAQRRVTEGVGAALLRLERTAWQGERTAPPPAVQERLRDGELSQSTQGENT